MPELTWGQMREAAKDQGFEPHPIGTYNFRVESPEVVPGKVAPQIRIRLRNMDGPYANRTVLNRLVPFKNDGEVNGMFFRQMSVLGFPSDHPIWAQIDQVGLEQGLAMIAPQLEGKMVIAEINHQNYQGEPRDNVKNMKPYGGAMVPGVPMQQPAPGGVPPQASPVPTPPAAPVPPSPVPPAAAPQAPQPMPTAPQPAPQPAVAPAQPGPVAAPAPAPAMAPAPEQPQMPAEQPATVPPAPAPGVPPVPQPPQPAQQQQEGRPF